MPLIYSLYLNETLDWSDVEYSSGKKWLKWEEVSLKWEYVDLTWDEVFILLEIVEKRYRGGGSGYPYRDEYEKNNPWRKLNEDLGKQNTDKVIKIYCRIRGIDYEKIKNPRKDIKVTVNEFDRFLNETVNVKIDFQK
jgi:hypothetical protein